MPKLETSAECQVKIENEEIKHAVSSVQLEQFINRHHVLKVCIRQLSRDSGSAEFKDPAQFTAFLGKSLSLSIQPYGGVVDSSLALEFIGVVTQVHLDNSIDEVNRVTIIAHSPTVALDGARRNTLHHEEVGSDIVEALLREYPITVGTVEPTQRTLTYSVQYRETDYDYIMRLSSGSGVFSFYDGKQFSVMKANSSNAEELRWRETLGAFSMGLGTAAPDFITQNWDQANKQVLEGDISGPPAGSSPSEMSRISLDAAEAIYTKPGFASAVKSTDMSSVDSALARAKEAAVGCMVTCEGQSIVPSVSVGRCVRINGMEDLDGPYWIKSVTHLFDESGKYHNTFQCTPLDISFPDTTSSLAKVTDLQSALVVDNNDPESLGRVKVKFPWKSGEETPWVRYVSQHAGDQRGWYSLPEIDDEVLVGFEHGNPDLPVVLGSLYNGKSKPHGDACDSENSVKMFMTRSGNQISFVDKDGSEEIRIAQKDGKNSIVVSLDGPAINVESEGDICIKGATISLESTAGDITVKSAGALKEESSADLELKAGMNLKSEASANHDIKAGVNCNVEGGAVVKVKGAMVQIN